MTKSLQYLITFLSILLFFGCIPVKQWNRNYTSIPETEKFLDIPKYDTNNKLNGYPFIYWHFCKQKEKQLGLESTELSNDSLIFRLWITNPVGRKGQPHGLIEIKHDFSKWTGDLYLMHVDFNVNTLSETITKYEKTELIPLKNEWNFIIDSLYQLRFDLLPTDEAIPDYYKDNSGYSNNSPTYSFEYTTENIYRFYQYNNFKSKTSYFWQADCVLKILKLLEDEFQWSSIGHDYFR